MSKLSNTALFSTFFLRIWLTESYRQFKTLIRINWNKCNELIYILCDKTSSSLTIPQYIYFIFVRAAHNVEKQVYVASVDASQAIEHNNFRVCPVCFAKQILLKGFLLLRRWKYILVVILCQYPVAIIIKDCHSFDCVQRRLLESYFNFVINKTTHIYTTESTQWNS